MSTNTLMRAPFLLGSSIIATVMTLNAGTTTTDSSYRYYLPPSPSGSVIAVEGAITIDAAETPREEQSKMYRGYSSRVRLPIGIALIMGVAATLAALLSLLPSFQSAWIISLVSLCGATGLGSIAAGRARNERQRSRLV
jgi:hypothetical protein